MDEATQRILPQHSAIIGSLAMLAAREGSQARAVRSKLSGLSAGELSAMHILDFPEGGHPTCSMAVRHFNFEPILRALCISPFG